MAGKKNGSNSKRKKKDEEETPPPVEDELVKGEDPTSNGKTKKKTKKTKKSKAKATTTMKEVPPIGEENIAGEVAFEIGGPPFRQWLFDRIDGTSNYKGITHRPPCSICFVPPPVKYCPSVVEDNVVCKKWGSIGCIDPEKDGEPRRILLMRIGFFFNFIAFLLTLFACTSIHVGGGKAIQSAAFSSCDVSEVENFFTNVATIDIGLRGIALQTPALRDNPNANGIQERHPLLNVNGGLQVITFDEFCIQGQKVPDVDLYVKDGECEACQDISNSLVSSIIMSTISFVPTLSTDILRMYYNYDVNCQKFFATILSFFTMIMSITTLVQYSTLCFDSFYEGTIPLNDDLSVMSSDSENDNNEDPSLPTFVLHFDWHMGPGLICLYLGTILKVIDIVVNIILPTPTITRNEDEQEEYEQQHSLRVLQRKQKEDINDEENPK